MSYQDEWYAFWDTKCIILKQSIFSNFLRNFVQVHICEGLTGLTNLPIF